MSKKAKKVTKKTKQGGRRDKMNLAADLLKKGQSRGDIIVALTKKYSKMSPAYAATIVQLTRVELGIHGASKKAKKATKESKPKTEKAEKQEHKPVEETKPSTKVNLDNW